MSIVNHIQNLFLIARKNFLEYKLFQNQEKVLSAMENPMSLQEAHNLDLQIALENASIRNELSIIEAQGKSLGKNLDTFA